MRRSGVLVVLGLSCLLPGCTPPAAGPITTAFDGVYHGNGYDASPPDWHCPSVMPADPLTVAKGEVSYDEFRGWVAPDGSVRLTSQEGTLDGKFQGTSFQGLQQFRIRLSPRPGCSYTLKLQRNA